MVVSLRNARRAEFDLDLQSHSRVVERSSKDCRGASCSPCRLQPCLAESPSKVTKSRWKHNRLPWIAGIVISESLQRRDKTVIRTWRKWRTCKCPHRTSPSSSSSQSGPDRTRSGLCNTRNTGGRNKRWCNLWLQEHISYVSRANVDSHYPAVGERRGSGHGSPRSR